MRTGLPYGQFSLPKEYGRQRHVYAHRMAWLLTHGAIPDGQKVCHHCDVPRCCNPSHLFLGTQAENLADCRRKGRMPSVRQRKLSFADRAAIGARLARGERHVSLASEFGVSRALISRMARQQPLQAAAPRPQQSHGHGHVSHRAFDVLHACTVASPSGNRAVKSDARNAIAGGGQ